MAMPDKYRIAKTLAALKNAEGTLALGENANVLDRFRWDLCQKFIRYKLKHKCSQQAMAEAAGVDEAKISKILHHRIDEFSTDRLIALYAKLDPRLKLKVS